MSEGSAQDVIVFSCAKCGKKYRVPKSAAGKRAKCAGCGENLEVPVPEAPPEEPIMVEEEAAGTDEPRPAQVSTVQAGLASANLAHAIIAKKAAKKKQTIIVLCVIGGLFVMAAVAWIPGMSGPPSSDQGKDQPAVPQTEDTKKYVPMLASPDNAVRSEAAFKLGEQPKHQAPYAADALVKAWKAEQEPRVKEALEKTMKRLGITPK
jgi:hypothetical protein